MRVVKAAILPLEFPRETLSAEDLQKLEALLKDYMGDDEESEDEEQEQESVYFDGIRFTDSMIICDAMNNTTVKWLTSFTNNPKGWEGVKLTVKTGEEIPQLHIIRVYLPRSRDMETAKALRIIRRNNCELKTKLWRVLKQEVKTNGQTLTLSIDDHSYKLIEKWDGKINYLFKHIYIRGLKKKKAQEVVVSDEGKMDVDVEKDESAMEAEHTPAVEKKTGPEDCSVSEDELLKEDENELDVTVIENAKNCK